MVQSSALKGSRATTALASCGVFGPVLRSAAAIGAGRRRAGYDLLRQTISELAERDSSAAWLMRLAYAVFSMAVGVLRQVWCTPRGSG